MRWGFFLPIATEQCGGLGRKLHEAKKNIVSSIADKFLRRRKESLKSKNKNCYGKQKNTKALLNHCIPNKERL
jgi:replication fork clamp-binding protein CrfC